jgi:hypothetical protein
MVRAVFFFKQNPGDPTKHGAFARFVERAR